MKKLITAILIVLCLSILFAMPAGAEEYTDPLATKFDDTVGYCDTFFDTLEWYAICQVSWTFVDWDYEGEPPLVQVPADEYEAEVAKYCVLSEELLAAIRSYTYYGDPIYNPETDTYTAFFVGGWGGYLHNRVYSGYVKTGDDTYDVYYETVTFEFLEDILPEGTTVEDFAGEDYPYSVEYQGYTYANSPDGFYRIKSYDKCGMKYGVKLENDRVVIATRTPYAVGQQPDVFDDVTTNPVLAYLTYEIVDGEAIITDCDESVEGDIIIPSTLGDYPVTAIGDSAFYDCSNLTSIAIPDSMISIGDQAFAYCFNLENITIPTKVTNIGDLAFLNCANLTGIWVEDGNANYSSDQCSVLFNKEKTELIYAPGMLSGSYTIPGSVTGINDYAFYHCTDLTGITIPNSVTTIGLGAFCGCSALTEITIPDSITSISNYAFYGCNRLIRIDIPDSVTEIGNCAFWGCNRVLNITIPDSVTTIGERAFSICSDAISIVIGNNVTTIGEYAFSSCDSLVSITIPDSVTTIGKYAFYSSDSNSSNVYYSGPKSEWENINIGKYNTVLSSATKHFSHTHDYSFVPTTTVPATCTDIGYTEYTCAYGETHRADYVPALGHAKGTNAVVIAPTCEEKGYTKSSCSRCGAETHTDYTDSIGHDFSGKETFVGPTCTKEGYTCLQCIYCNETINIDHVDALGHSMVYKEAETATCTKDGHTAGTLCSRCGLFGTAKKIAHPVFSLPTTDYTYDGRVKNPSATVKDTDGKTLVEGTDYIVSYPDGRKELGSYNIVITMKGNYSGSHTLTFYVKLGTPVVSVDNDIVLQEHIGLSWNKIAGAKSYTVYRSVYANGKWSGWNAIATGITSTYYNDQNTDVSLLGKTVRYTVKAISGKHTSNYKASDSLIIHYAHNATAENAPAGVKITWSSIPGAKSYSIYREIDLGGWEQIKRSVAGTTYFDTTMPAGNPANYAIIALYDDADAEFNIDTSYAQITNVNLYVEAPTVKAANVSNGVKITWNKIQYSDIDDFYYVIYKSVYSGDTWSGWKAIKTGVTGTTYTDTSVKSGDNVKYTVRAFNGRYTSSFKSSNSIKFLATPNVTVANATNGVKISWNKVSGAKNYTVYKSVYSGGKWSGWKEIKTGVTGMTYTDTSVKSNNNVKYTVRAFNGSHSSTYKASSSIKFLAAPTVKATNAVNGVKISWNAIAGAKNYKVYKSVYANGVWSGWKAIKTGVTGTTYTDTSVKSNDNVKYTVRAFNGNFSSTFKSSSSIKFLATPTVKAANAAKGVTVTWNKITGAKTYTVYRSVYSGGKWSGWTAIKTGVTGTSYTDTTVKSGATVRYTVKAINGNFRSNVKTGNTTKFLAQPTVKVAKATNGIKTSWGKITGASGYIVYRRTYTNGKWSGWTAIKTTTAVSFTDTTAKKGVTYQYTVRAYSGDCRSSYTNSSSIKR